MRKPKFMKVIGLALIFMVVLSQMPENGIRALASNPITLGRQQLQEGTNSYFGGTVTYEPENNTIILENVKVDDGGHGLYIPSVITGINNDEPVRIYLKGENYFGTEDKPLSRTRSGIYTSRPIEVYGDIDAKLICYINRGGNGIYAAYDVENVSINGGTYVFHDTAKNDTDGFNVSGGLVKIENANITIASTNTTIWGGLGITIKNSSVTAVSEQSNAIFTNNKLMISDNSDVTASSFNPALFSESDMTISNSKVYATSSNDLGIWSRDTLSIEGKSDVICKGTGGCLGAISSASITPVTGERVEVYTGVDEDIATAMEGSPFSQKTNLAGIKTNPYFHSYSHTHTAVGTWSKDDATHWHGCTANDGKRLDEAAHTASNWIIDREATITAVGKKHKECTICHQIMETADIPMLHIHIPSDVWSKNDTVHWHNCTADDNEKLDQAAHIASEWILDKEATISTSGSKHKECIICGYVMQTEIIPMMKAEEAGSIEKKIKRENNAPGVQIPMSNQELTNAVLTQEEIRSIEHGIDITILLTVTDAADSISAKDKTIMEKALDHYSIGQYLDISLLKIIDGEQSRLTKTSGSIKITIDIPDSLKNKDNTGNREFVILRMHDGLAVILNDLDTDANTITIETDRFSNYAIAYRDIPAEGDLIANTTTNTNTNNNKNVDKTQKYLPKNKQKQQQLPATGDDTMRMSWLTASLITGMLAILLLSYLKRKRTDK